MARLPVMEWVTNPEVWIALLTLTTLEVVLGIDNIVFISILANKLPLEQRARGRKVGLAVALLTRLALLMSIVWIARLTEPLVVVLGEALSGRDIILLIGGLFLLAKATREIHHSMEVEEAGVPSGEGTFASVVVQIALIDIVFSLDSVITAVGMTTYIGVMVAAVIISIAVMMIAAGPIADFVERHPSVKVLALSFLLLIGVTLIGDGLDFHIPKGYVYFAMGFSVFVEMLNLRRARAARNR